jgi:hypothetical protein
MVSSACPGFLHSHLVISSVAPRCNAYNVSSAAACLLSIAFGVSTFFDVKDLYASKLSPRTRV